MRFYFLLVLILFSLNGLAQDCGLSITGRVIDRATREPLAYATLKIEESRATGAVTDEEGFFEISGLCQGEYHIVITYVGYEPERIYIVLENNLEIDLPLGQFNELLNEIVVHGEKEEKTTEVHNVIDADKIRSEGNKSLGDVLENVSGVSTIRNGTGVSKPVIHGLYGNRITILNNGIVQAGQQWGNDHAPEVDPFVADHISVVKGASALQYGGNSIGGVVMIDPYRIGNDPHLHGNATYVFQSNGRGHTFNAQLEQASKLFSWRASGTGKYVGDYKAPNYYLTNTGKRELNGALQLERSWANDWFTSVYYSIFTTDIGILRGSHVGNLSDLEEAINREVPFFTRDKFSYEINAPHQRVGHHLLKAEVEKFIDEKRFLKIQYGGQIDNRREYDVRRGDRSDMPALSLQLFSHILDVIYEHKNDNDWNYKLGLQGVFEDNTNVPETGILPLIPDYRSYAGSVFAVVQRAANAWLLEAGVRYDIKDLNVITITRTPPRELERFDHLFQNIAVNLGAQRQFGKTLKLSYNLGFAQRAPEVNELYSYGLHQGVSGIEEGSPNLVSESSFKNILSLDWKAGSKFQLQGLGYFQYIDNYIFLEPQEEFRLTIRGAFPVYIYKQTDANIYGADFTLRYRPARVVSTDLVYSIVRGHDVANDIPLVFIPSDNITAGISILPGINENWRDNKIGLRGRYVFEQSRILPGQDFLMPPDGYFLLSLEAATGFEFGDSHLDLNLRVENMLNTVYRDYLNRMRYFADEPGINFIVSVNYAF